MSSAERAVERSARISLAGLGRAVRGSFYLPVMALAVLLAADLAVGAIAEGWLGFDFRGTLWEPAIAITEGRSPYPALDLLEVGVGNPALYPPLLMIVLAPITLLPWSVGVTLWTLLLSGAAAGALHLLGVRDWRCYAVAAASLPVVTGVVWGNVTVLLLLLVALAWRWRDRWAWTGVVVGLAIASKLFLWPLLLWLVGTRRYKASVAAVAAAVLCIFVPWAAIGFDGLATYPDLLRLAEELYAVHGYSVATMASAVGVETAGATWMAFSVGLALALLALLVGRAEYDGAAISIAIVAAILGSPIVWEYYYALLVIPLAIFWPRFSPAWLLLLALYVTHRLPRPKLPASELEPGGSACCKPDGVPMASWVFNHAPPGLWPALGHALVAILIVALAVVAARRQQESDVEAARRTA